MQAQHAEAHLVEDGVDLVLLVGAAGLERILRRAMVLGALGDGTLLSWSSTALTLTGLRHEFIRGRRASRG